MPMRFVLSFFLLIFSFPVWSVSVNWSGWTRLEAYYQHSDSHNYYGNYHFVLQPEIHVTDGLTVTGRLDLFPISSSLGDTSSYENKRQRGFVFIYGENSKQSKITDSPLFLRASQIYLDYEAEFFNIRLGRAPYHFGMGMIHSASQDPFQHWITVYNQVLLYLEYSKFYLQPMVFHRDRDKGTLLGAAQAGLVDETWKAEALYQYDFNTHSFLELFGEYEQDNWGLKSSFAYAFKRDVNVAAALEAFVDIPVKIPLQFELKVGGAMGDLSFHSNYNVALLYWNRLMKDNFQTPPPQQENVVSLEQPLLKEKPDPLPFQIAQGQIQKGIYISPRLLFSFFDDSLKVRPLGLFARDLQGGTFNYEFDLETGYQLDESLFFFSYRRSSLQEDGVSLCVIGSGRRQLLIL